MCRVHEHGERVQTIGGMKKRRKRPRWFRGEAAFLPSYRFYLLPAFAIEALGWVGYLGGGRRSLREGWLTIALQWLACEFAQAQTRDEVFIKTNSSLLCKLARDAL